MTLERSAVTAPHLGKGRTLLAIEEFCRIMGGGQIIREVRMQCLPCRRQLQRTCINPPGKVHPAMLKLPSQHHSFVMLDIIPSVRVAAFANQKVVRNTVKPTIHILLGVCMSTKLCSFVFLSNKTESDLAEGISALTAKMGRSPLYLFTDRESGLLPLARDTGSTNNRGSNLPGIL